MWSKSIAAILGGCLVSISLMLNINYLLPFMIDTRLLVGLLAAFPLWIATMIYCYGSDTAKQAWKRCGLILLVSVGVNSIYILSS